MPRKPSLGPGIIRIERLSDGREVRPQGLIDDFTQEPIPHKPDTRAARVLPSAQAVQDQRNRERVLAQKQMLEALMPQAVTWPRTLPMPKPQEVLLVPKGKRVVGHLDGKAVMVQMPPWRRA